MPIGPDDPPDMSQRYKFSFTVHDNKNKNNAVFQGVVQLQGGGIAVESRGRIPCHQIQDLRNQSQVCSVICITIVVVIVNLVQC